MKLFITAILLFSFVAANACSILFYVDTKTGKVYAVNNEDYWLDVNAYMKIIPASDDEMARLWYGWDNFAQGGINQAGLFFDGAVTPEQPLPKGYHLPKNNIGDLILAHCKNVEEAVDYLEEEKIALTTGHLLFGDRSGDGVIIEWIGGEKKLTRLRKMTNVPQSETLSSGEVDNSKNYLMITNYLVNDTAAGNYPCVRAHVMQQEIDDMQNNQLPIDMKSIGGVLAKSVQVPVKNTNGRESGTLYSSFFDITDMRMTIVYKLNNHKKLQLDLKTAFSAEKARTIYLKDIEF